MDGCKHVDRGEYSETWNMVKNGNRVAKLNMTPANRTCTRICIFAVQSRADLQDPRARGCIYTLSMYALPCRDFDQHPASTLYIVHYLGTSAASIQHDLAHQTASATWPFCQQAKPFMLLLVLLFFLPCLSFPGSLAARLADALLFPAVHMYTPGNRTRGGSLFQAVRRSLSTGRGRGAFCIGRWRRWFGSRCHPVSRVGRVTNSTSMASRGGRYRASGYCFIFNFTSFIFFYFPIVNACVCVGVDCTP